MKIIKRITFVFSLCLLLFAAVPDKVEASTGTATGNSTVSYVSEYEQPEIIQTGTPVKTGDQSRLDISILMVIISAALILLIIIIERRREKEEEF